MFTRHIFTQYKLLCWKLVVVAAVCLLHPKQPNGWCAAPEENAAERSQSPSVPTSVPTDFGRPATLPRPSDMSVNEFEGRLYEFVNTQAYKKLGWLADKSVRDTGPFINGVYYGTHPAVKIYYSPGVVRWLVEGRKGEIPDGAVIIKEQYRPPAVRYEDLDDEQLWEMLESWTIMVKDSKGSHDGWFWSNPAKNQKVVNYFEYPFEEPYSGFGLYCLRCHGSTQSPGIKNEYTFSALRNIEGFPGEPLLFRVDESWREKETKEDHSNEALLADVAHAEQTDATPDVDQSLLGTAHPRCAESDQPTRCIPELNEDFLACFSGVSKCDRADVLHFPPVTYDSVPRQSLNPDQQAFLTSNQCMSCHAGITEPFGPTMFIPTGDEKSYGAPGLHVSPYGEWRWTPMGLAGRDPVFFAQLESELSILKKTYDAETAYSVGRNLQQTCLSCHGVMGKRQHDIDLIGKSHGVTNPDEMFQIEDIYAHQVDPKADDFANSKYAALARDGVSCVVCHRMQPRPQPEGDNRSYLEHFLDTSITGNFFLGKPGEMYGPFKDDQLAPYVMDHSIAFKPKHSEFIKTSQMCGTCHTVNLPILNWKSEAGETHNDLMQAETNPAFRDYHHHVEQATYLEWLNSQYENEFNENNPNAKSCQDCHMSKGIHDENSDTNIAQIQTSIATIQDKSYPDAENLAAHKELNVRHRKEGYSRHNFRGLNVFMVEMFNQFDDVLGVRKHDYMTGSKTDLELAVNDFVRQASMESATIDVNAKWDADRLHAEVDVTNLAGHRFPSGVGFRRLFVELLVLDESKPEEQQIVWASGRTNSLGAIIGDDGEPLVTEFFDSSNPDEEYQPHYETISSPNQVQIYETLLHTVDGEFTTSFIHGCTTVKDNRLLPKGWSKSGPGPALKGHFLTATYPGPEATKDGRYQDGSGSDVTSYVIDLPPNTKRDKLRVQATLYYQAIPPYFLKNIFDASPEGLATRRLHYICSNMKLEGTVIEDWKLKVVTASSKP